MMYLKASAVFTVFLLLSFSSFADTFRKQIAVAPKTTETVVVHTLVPVSFNAQFVGTDYVEAQECGNCLHIETMVQGAKNQAASPFGVGFMLILPEDGVVSVVVFHD